ncbi:hypothetical protein ADIAL_1997 [Alkalibacterium sp. AK22]|uniref:pilus assembly PilX N-terminal domain-containing protein n=1 Tax=Alkalibacterium sp. AK22 TaxID=1229520 RepID=UPI0004483320|nr:pilus assembly PilX N-terminal domain-containing protein [Alkalibacterium sp. AK22]EXJ22411.1 hypothetical protein ADIAL_1997 [Alkalibacterium sp. AK22]
MKRYLSELKTDEEGSGLILALMTLVVLAVLGASLGAITIGSHRLSATNRDDSSAYYIAEAGANQAYDEIERLVWESKTASKHSFFSKIDNHTFKEGTIIKDFAKELNRSVFSEVSLNKISEVGNSKTYDIISEGNVDGSKRIVVKKIIITWMDNTEESSFPSIPEGASLIANDYLFVGGNILSGNVIINNTKRESAEITYTNVDNATFFHPAETSASEVIRYPSWNKPKTQPLPQLIEWNHYKNAALEFPDIPVFHSVEGSKSIRLDGGLPPAVVQLKENVSYDKIELNSERVLRFDIGDRKLKLTVNDLLINNGHIEIVGDGSLILYVKNKMYFGSSSTLNRKANHPELLLYYGGAPAISLSGNQRLNGSIFSRKANIHITGSAEIKGVIVSGGEKVTYSGNTFSSPLVFAPFADIELTGSGAVNGIIVGDTVRMGGGSVVRHSPYNFNEFPFKLNRNSENQKDFSKEIISSDPIIETK